MFCRRGRQNLRELKKTDFSFRTDGKGERYVCKTTDELTKNRREDDEGLHEGGTMFEKTGPHCPVASFEKYLQHLNPKTNSCFSVRREMSAHLIICGTTTWSSESVHLASK